MFDFVTVTYNFVTLLALDPCSLQTVASQMMHREISVVHTKPPQKILEPGMGFEPTSAIVGFYTAGCGKRILLQPAA